MNIYIVVLQDRHIDVGVYPFTDLSEAIKKAKDLAVGSCNNPDDYKEEVIDGWEFFAVYSCEGDFVSVRECELINIAKGGDK